MKWIMNTDISRVLLVVIGLVVGSFCMPMQVGAAEVALMPTEDKGAPHLRIIDIATGDPTVVTLTLTVNNVGAVRTDTLDSMTIDLYDNACDAAAIGLNVSLDQGDLDTDCLTGLTDFYEMSAAWDDDYSLTEPIPKP